MKSNWEIGRLLLIVGLFFAVLIILATSPGAGFTYEGTPGVKPATAGADRSATTIGPSGIPVLARENTPAGSINRSRGVANPNQTVAATNSIGSVALIMPGSRNLKINLDAVDAREILDKVAALPMTTWKYRGQERMVRHLGPISENFKAAFQLGETDSDIALVDESGVALAAIQGLNEKVELQAAQLKERDARIKLLEKRLDNLEKLMVPVAQR